MLYIREKKYVGRKSQQAKSGVKPLAVDEVALKYMGNCADLHELICWFLPITNKGGGNMICKKCGIQFNEEDSNANNTEYCDKVCECI